MLRKKSIKRNSFQITTPEHTGKLKFLAQPNIVICYFLNLPNR